MPNYFSLDELHELHRAAIDGDLFDRRAQLMAGTPGVWRAGVTKVNDDTGQVLIDLVALNEADLDDNVVPFDTWLTNASGLTRGHKSGRIFREYQIRLRGLLRATPVPDPKSVPEAETTITKVSREVVLGVDERVSFAWLAAGVRTGASVVKLIVPVIRNGARNGKEGFGTGWVLAPNVIITCYHVLEARVFERASAADFDQQALASDILVDFDHAGAVPQVLHVAKVLFKDEVLDVALVEIREPNTLAPLTLRTTELTTPSAAAPLAINIIQHPNGAPKRLGFRNNALTAAEGRILRYFTDTDPGSSGSPLCDDSWNVVGIHRASEETKATKLGDATITFINIGHQMAQILTALKANAALWARLEPGLSRGRDV